MFRGLLGALVAAALPSAILVAQEVAPPPPPTAPAAPALQRAIDDATAACRKILAEPHAFRGTCQCQTQTGTLNEAEPTAFAGAWQGGIAYVAIRDQRILQHGKLQLVATEQGPWTMPQGDAPDCPFAPMVIAQHFAAAAADTAEVTDFDGRPAVRVHATWQGAAAAALLDAVHHPTPKHDAVLERLARVNANLKDRLRVDAVLVLDPATKRLYASALRIAVMNPQAAPEPPAEDQNSTAMPFGLPPSPQRAALQFVFTFTVHGPEAVPMPELDDALRERLGRPPPATTTTPRPAAVK